MAVIDKMKYVVELCGYINMFALDEFIRSEELSYKSQIDKVEIMIVCNGFINTTLVSASRRSSRTLHKL